MSHFVVFAANIALTVFTSAAVATPRDSAVERELRQITQKMLDAVAPGDTDVWRKYLDERIIHVDETGALRTKAQLLDELRPLPKGLVGSMHIDRFNVEVHGVTAVVTFEAQEQLNFYGQPLRSRFRVTDTWQHTSNGWRLIGEHVSAVLKDPPTVSLSQQQLCGYEGNYSLTADIAVTIRCTSTGLIAHRIEREPVVYLPEFPDVFFAPGQPRTRRIFQRDLGGRVTGFVDRREGEDVRWKKSAAAVPQQDGSAKPDEPTVALWQPARISSSSFESHPAFDPITGDFYFVRSSPDFTGWRLFMSSCQATSWAEPVPPSFAGDGVEADPWFTPDGQSLYFISTRTTDGIKRDDLDIWRVERAVGSAWGVAHRLPAPVNSKENEWFPRLAADGWLYFGSKRPGGLGKTDIWRAREVRGTWTIENLGPSVNTADDEYEAEISSDGSDMIIMTNAGLFESSRDGQAWSERRRLPSPINDHGGEVGPLFLENGNVLYAKNMNGALSGEFYLWHRAKSGDPAPRCPVSP